MTSGPPMTCRPCWTAGGCDGEDVSPHAGTGLYLWHCNIDGDYSLYSDAIKDENFLRGASDRFSGTVTDGMTVTLNVP